MSLLISANTTEDESILPEVEELSEFHPDQISNFVGLDIQEELEKLEVDESVGVEAETSLATVDDVNVVDHEVTIVAEQGNEEVSILPEISDTNYQQKNLIKKQLSQKECKANVFEKKDFVNLPVSSKSGVQDSQSLATVTVKPTNNSSLIKQLAEKKAVSSLSNKKNVLTKVIFTNNQAASDAPIMLNDSGGQTIKLVGHNKAIFNNLGTKKAITFAQAKEMGLISPGKMHILPNQTKCIAKKNVLMSSNKTLTMLKSSPTKILPQPTTGQLHSIVSSQAINALAPHKIVFRQSPSTAKPVSFANTIVSTGSVGATGHILQLPMASQDKNQIHQIHLPGKQVQYVRLVNSVSSSASSVPESVVVTSSSPSVRPVPVALSTNISNASQLKMVSIAPVSSSSSQNTSSFERVVVSSGMSQQASSTENKPATTNIVMVPAEYVKQYTPQLPYQSPPSPLKSSATSSSCSPPTPPPQLLHHPVSSYVTKAKEVAAVTMPVLTAHKIKASADSHNGIRPRKACNCTKSQCLKLYCDCFANGEFCFQCNCNCCFNNLDHEEERQRAIKACLERNPNAFRPKIGKGYIGDERRHNKGCNCKRSGCLKNYCECYEAKIPCSNNCKCIGCRNVEEIRGRDKSSGEGKKTNPQATIKSKLSCEIQECSFNAPLYLPNQNARQPSNLMTQEVVEATCQCLLAQVQSSYKMSEQVEWLILEEFGRCLVEIIDCATRTTVPHTT